MDIYTAGSKSGLPKKVKNKKAGLIVLFLWFVSLITFILLIKASVPSGTLYDAAGVTALIATFVLLPVWGFLLGNKLVRILTIGPTIFVVVFFLIYLFILRPHKLSGPSMEPNFIPGEYLLSEKVTYYFNDPKRGDVIVFKAPDIVSMVINEEFFARIVGLPGEYISIRNNHVYINNKILNEPYVGPDIVTNAGLFIGEKNVLIPEGAYVILGDNREHSNDSRYYAFIKKSAITGRVFYVYWPPAKSGAVKNPLEAF